jgi:hypothetical protein
VPDDDVRLEIATPDQTEQETKQEKKEREKRLREFNDDVAFAKASNSLNRGYFVLIADCVQLGNWGTRNYSVNPNANFVLVQGNDGIIQFALNGPSAGSNGLGGWTGKGHVRNKRVKNCKNGDVYLEYQLTGPSVNAYVNVTLFHNTNQAQVRVSGGVNMIFYGKILPYRDKDHR